MDLEKLVLDSQYMNNRWEKGGLIYNADSSKDWSKSHAQLPICDKISNEIWRIYFSTRDAEGRSRPSYIEVEAGNPKNILYIHDNFLLDIGKIGTFDDCGVIGCSIVDYQGGKYMYYAGWTVRNTIPYHNSIGLAISEDGGKTFHKFSEGPIFSPTYLEPYFTGTSYVMIENGIWRNWYLSCTGWKLVNGKAEPLYHIKYAESKNGIDWERNGVVAIDYENGVEGGINRASVLKENGIYKMWYAYRSSADYRKNTKNSYRVGYAESPDGIVWKRLDSRSGVDISKDGWDADMISYPHVIKHGDKKFMFYNGNGFGASGFGFATI